MPKSRGRKPGRAGQTPAGDWRFTANGAGGRPASLTLAEIPLPAGIPPAVPMP